MGALGKAAENVSERRRGPGCSVGLALAAMDDDDRATLTGWVPRIMGRTGPTARQNR